MNGDASRFEVTCQKFEARALIRQTPAGRVLPSDTLGIDDAAIAKLTSRLYLIVTEASCYP